MFPVYSYTAHFGIPVQYRTPHYPFHRAQVPFRQYPEVDPSIFMSSAQHMQPLLRDAGTLLNKMAESRKFSYDLMSAAQESDKQRWKKLSGSRHQIIPKITSTIRTASTFTSPPEKTK